MNNDDRWLRFKRNKLGVAGLFMVLSVVACALAAPLLSPHDPLYQSVWSRGIETSLTPPSLEFPMGTDIFGRDILSRVLHGSRISLQVAFWATLVTLLLGVPLGAFSGYCGGWVDDVISWIVNVVFAFPFMLFVLAVIAVFKNPGLTLIYVSIGAVNWVTICRITRAQFIALRDAEFVQAARALGLPLRRILFRHILPNAVAPLLVQTTLGMGAIIMLESGLAFLGFGAQPPTPSWGLMISEGQMYLPLGEWWCSIFPGLAIVYTVLGFNFLGDGLRDALDVRMRKTG